MKKYLNNILGVLLLFFACTQGIAKEVNKKLDIANMTLLELRFEVGINAKLDKKSIKDILINPVETEFEINVEYCFYSDANKRLRAADIYVHLEEDNGPFANPEMATVAFYVDSDFLDCDKKKVRPGIFKVKTNKIDSAVKTLTIKNPIVKSAQNFKIDIYNSSR